MVLPYSSSLACRGPQPMVSMGFFGGLWRWDHAPLLPASFDLCSPHFSVSLPPDGHLSQSLLAHRTAILQTYIPIPGQVQVSPGWLCVSLAWPSWTLPSLLYPVGGHQTPILSVSQTPADTNKGVPLKPISVVR